MSERHTESGRNIDRINPTTKAPPWNGQLYITVGLKYQTKLKRTLLSRCFAIVFSQLYRSCLPRICSLHFSHSLLNALFSFPTVTANGPSDKPVSSASNGSDIISKYLLSLWIYRLRTFSKLDIENALRFMQVFPPGRTKLPFY